MDIQTLLRAWGISHAMNHAPNDYPKQAAFVRLMSRGNVSVPPLPDEYHQRIDGVVSSLKHRRPDFYEVICYAYVAGLSDVRISKKIKCNRWQAREMRVAAEAYVEAKLET